ncbi:MAG: hypothetical protein KIS81_06320 [Maricaulaceae bacterium]|nr:hypothetical protein [Maricaulaceae bacterium]
MVANAKLMEDLRRRILQAGPAAPALCHIIGLNLIRQGAGRSWPRLRRRVLMVSENFIRKRLQPDDYLMRCEGGFLIVFHPRRAGMAAARAAAISIELNGFYLGDEFLRSLQIRSESRRVDDLDALAGLTVQPPHNGHAANDGPGFSQITPGQISIVYRPVWNAGREAIGAWFCTPRAVLSGKLLYGRDILMGHDDPEAFLELDCAAAEAAAAAFDALMARGRKCAISLPVSYETLAAPAARVQYLSFLRMLPETMRRYAALRISGTPQGAPSSRRQEVFRCVRPYCASLLAHTALDARELERFDGCGIDVFGFTAPKPDAGDGYSPQRLNLARSFAAAAESLGAQTYVSRAPTLAALQQLHEAGASFFSGDLFGPEAPAPAPPGGLPLASLAGEAEPALAGAACNDGKAALDPAPL